jgi:endonuclease/exonuclease/phosphatase family metal-dependent hydrolase
MNRPIRVLTWNLWWRFGPWLARASAIRTVLHEASADICGFQEVWSEEGHNLAGELAAELGMQWTWAASPRSERWQARLPGCTAEVGHAILARWPIRERAVLPLPAGGSGDDSRHALFCLVESPDGRIPVVTTQLSPAPWESATRCDQVRALVQLLADRRREDYPAVLLGDLNAEPDSDEVRLMCGQKTAPAPERFCLVDAWRYAPSDAIPWTWDRENPHVRSTMEPSSRIDYVLVGLPRDDRRGHVRSVARIGSAPVDGVWPSDHAGVLAELAAGRA